MGNHRRARVALVMVTMLAASWTVAPIASAASNSGAPAGCRQADEAGILDALGLTFGECVTLSRVNADRNPIANNVNAGLCGWDAFVSGIGATTKGDCMHRLDASGHVPFTASLAMSSDASLVVVGGGSALRIGRVGESGEVYFIDSSNYPLSADFYIASTLTNGRGESIFVDYKVTLTDTADPPAETNYAVTGSFGFIDGTGRFAGITGNGHIAGACTSGPGDPNVACKWTWTGVTNF